MTTACPQLVTVYPNRADAWPYRYLTGLDRLDREQLDPALLIAVVFYPLITERWAAAGLLRPGEEPPPERDPGREARAQEIAEEVISTFSSRGSLSRRARAIAVRITMAQRLLRRGQGHKVRAARLVARDWFPLALRLLRIAVVAEDEDPEIAEIWERRLETFLEEGGVPEATDDDRRPRHQGRRRRGGRRRGGQNRGGSDDRGPRGEDPAA
jgi:hypothetical protein